MKEGKENLGMIRKNIVISKDNRRWLKEKKGKLGISESEIIRRLIDKEIAGEINII